MSADDGEANVGARSDRSHFRVSARIPLVYAEVDPQEARSLTAEILATLDPPPVECDPGLAAWLDQIDRKLDRVLSALGNGPRPLLQPEDAADVMLSVSGMSFRGNRDVEVGSDLLLNFEIPGDRTRVVRCLARVVHCSKNPPGPEWAIGVTYVTIRPVDVDAIVRFTISVQRQHIRASHSEYGPER